MGLQDKMVETHRQIQATMQPYLGGEPATGFGYGTRRKSAFKQEMVLFAVTATRAVFVAADRRMQPTGEVIALGAPDVVKSSVDGIGGGLGHFLGNSEGEVWIDTVDNGRLKLMLIGDGIIERSMLGDDGVSGGRALCEWLATVRDR